MLILYKVALVRPGYTFFYVKARMPLDQRITANIGGQDQALLSVRSGVSFSVDSATVREEIESQIK